MIIITYYYYVNYYLLSLEAKSNKKAKHKWHRTENPTR